MVLGFLMIAFAAAVLSAIVSLALGYGWLVAVLSYIVIGMFTFLLVTFSSEINILVKLVPRSFRTALKVRRNYRRSN